MNLVLRKFFSIELFFSLCYTFLSCQKYIKMVVVEGIEVIVAGHFLLT